MTTEHIDLATLSAFADGDANAVSAQRVERHIAQCGKCAHELKRVRALVAGAAALPRDIAPPPAAWSEISRRITHNAPRTERWWHNGWLAAAAAVMLIAGTASVMWFAVNRNATSDAQVARANTTPAVLVVERSYAPTLVELRAAFESQRSTLSPATARTLDHSLAVIDSAIAEARSALAADPASTALSEMLSGYYQRKVDFLKRANTLSSTL